MSQYKIIGITGPAGSGKDTAADYLLQRLPHGYRKRSFAQPIKEMVQTGLNLSTEQVYGSDKDIVDERYGITPRRMLQTLGTEWGRELVHPDVWVKAMEAVNAVPGYGELVIPDVRFKNEAEFVRANGKLIHIVGRNENDLIMNDDNDHISEAGIEILPDDIVIRNEDLIETFYDYISEAIKYL